MNNILRNKKKMKKKERVEHYVFNVFVVLNCYIFVIDLRLKIVY